MRSRSLVLLGGLLWASPGAAHHVVSDSGIAWVEPISVVEVDVEAADFSHGERDEGVWQRIRVTGQWALHERLSVSLQVPWTSVQFADGRGAMGNGDLEVGARVELWGTEHGEFLLSAGVGAELPTGVSQDQLGNGHFELAPFLALSTQWHPNWLGFALLSSRHAITGRDLPVASDERMAHGSVISPHAMDEGFVRLGLAYVQQDAWYVSGGVDAVLMYQDPARGPWVGRAEVGVHAQPWWRLSLGADLTMAGEARFGRKVRVSSALFF